MSFLLRKAAAPLAAALASALLVSACGRSAPEPDDVARASVKPAPAVGIAEPDAGELPHMVRPVIVRPPSGGAMDGDRDPTAASPVEAAPATPAGPASSRTADRRTTAIEVEPPRARATPPAPPEAGPARVRPVDTPVPAPRRAVAAPTPEPRHAPPATTTAAARDPGQARGLNQEGIRLIAAGRPDQAVAPLQRAVALQPQDAEMLGNLGYAYMLTGELDRAVAHFLRSLDVSPTRSATWLNLGQTYAELGQRDRAVEAVLTGYRYSSRKASVRAALQRAATGSRHSAAWREAAGRALAQIGSG